MIVPALILAASTVTSAPAAHPLPTPAALESEVAAAMRETGAKGLAIALIDDGKIVYVHAFGTRNSEGLPLANDTVMYGASLTKTLFAYGVMQLVDEGRVALDAPIASMLPQSLVDYPPDRKYANWGDLKDDNRWRLITPRHVLTHSTGLPNYAVLEDDHKLHIHFDPGTRYAYSGAGMSLLQFGLEKGMAIDVGMLSDEIFRRLGMTRSSLTWRPEFAGNVADGWNDKGQVEPHIHRAMVRAASSMDTTIDDMAKFAAALAGCVGLSAQSCSQMTSPQLHISSKQQFPTLRDSLQLPPEAQRRDLNAGLGVVTFEGPQGRGFYKAGHGTSTANVLVCVRPEKRCLVMLSNDVRAEKAFTRLTDFTLGKTGVPFGWEYGDQAGRS